jgi:hypothetical protein
MKKKQKRGARRKAREKLVEFVSLRPATIITAKEGLTLLLQMCRSRNKLIDTEATYARALPMLIDRANRKLHRHGLHLVLEEKGALLLHRADGKTRGTYKEKAERAKEAVIAELNEVAAALVKSHAMI